MDTNKKGKKIVLILYLLASFTPLTILMCRTVPTTINFASLKNDLRRLHFKGGALVNMRTSLKMV